MMTQDMDDLAELRRYDVPSRHNLTLEFKVKVIDDLGECPLLTVHEPPGVGPFDVNIF